MPLTRSAFANSFSSDGFIMAGSPQKRRAGRPRSGKRLSQPLELLDDRVAHFLGADLPGAVGLADQQVAGAVARLEHVLDRPLDQVGFLAEVERVAEHHRVAE